MPFVCGLIPFAVILVDCVRKRRTERLNKFWEERMVTEAVVVGRAAKYAVYTPSRTNSELSGGRGRPTPATRIDV